jgi:hypothetical protein
MTGGIRQTRVSINSFNGATRTPPTTTTFRFAKDFRYAEVLCRTVA